MEELKKIAKDLRAYFEQKRSKTLEDKVPNGHVLGFLQNRENDIVAFEQAIKSANKHPFLKNEVVKNFAKNAEEIKNKLDEL